MNVPIPVLVAVAAAMLILLLLALRRRGAGRDLIAPPPSLGGSAPTPPPAAPGGGPVVLPEGVEADVRQLMRDQRKIEAIKIVRHATGLGLAEAKDYVERL